MIAPQRRAHVNRMGTRLRRDFVDFPGPATLMITPIELCALNFLSSFICQRSLTLIGLTNEEPSSPKDLESAGDLGKRDLAAMARAATLVTPFVRFALSKSINH